MDILLTIMTIILSSLYSPINDNFTHLMSTKYVFLYYAYFLILSIYLLYSYYNLSKNNNDNSLKVLCIIAFSCFIIGTMMPYSLKIETLFNQIHTLGSLIGCILDVLIIKKLIQEEILKGSSTALTLNNIFNYSLITICILGFIFTSINGIIEGLFIILNIYVIHTLSSLH
ncbi:MAG: hypothetical protein PHH04_04050 [Thomasclavelia sp.]|nr:hypothetical protein [Thomasclavelia sp.]